MKPSCYNRPAFVQIVHSDEFEVSYPFRMLESCAAWMPGGNTYVRPYGTGQAGKRFEWADCDGCMWKDNAVLRGEPLAASPIENIVSEQSQEGR